MNRAADCFRVFWSSWYHSRAEQRLPNNRWFIKGLRPRDLYFYFRLLKLLLHSADGSYTSFDETKSLQLEKSTTNSLTPKKQNAERKMPFSKQEKNIINAVCVY